MPSMKTTPGAGSGDGAGDSPLATIAEKAANSAASILPAGAPATPMPPTSAPPRKIGSPPGFTASGLVSFGVPERSTTLPVTGPVPQPELSKALQAPPATEVARGRNLPVLKATLRSQPRLVFSIP